VDEGDAVAAGPLPGNLIDQLVSSGTAGREGGIEVGDAVADVVNAGAPAGEKAGDRPLGIQRRQQLHLRVTEAQTHDGRAVGHFGRGRLQPENITIKRKRRVEIGHSDPDMGDPGVISHTIPPRSGRAGTNSEENNIMAATNSHTVHVTDASFTSEIEQADGLVLVDFWATWCGPCQIVAPVLDQLAGEYVGRAKVAKVDVDSNQRTAMRFNVRSIPSILFFKNGQHVDTVIGAVPKATIEGKIKQHLT
jgi:thioredoxin 1